MRLTPRPVCVYCIPIQKWRLCVVCCSLAFFPVSQFSNQARCPDSGGEASEDTRWAWAKHSRPACIHWRSCRHLGRVFQAEEWRYSTQNSQTRHSTHNSQTQYTWLTRLSHGRLDLHELTELRIFTWGVLDTDYTISLPQNQTASTQKWSCSLDTSYTAKTHTQIPTLPIPNSTRYATNVY